MKRIEEVEQPLNANERFLYAVVVRLDAIIDMMSSMVEVYANQNNMAITNNEIKEEIQEVQIVRKSRKK